MDGTTDNKQNFKSCSHCGAKVAADAVFCEKCGAKLIKDNQEQPAVEKVVADRSTDQSEKEAPQPIQEQAQQSSQQINSDDKNNVPLDIVSFIFPIVGLILWLVFKDSSPVKAKNIGMWALIGAGLQFMVGFIHGFIQGVSGAMGVIYTAL